ncbi:MAG: NapC/NirT family cytochrome c [Gammaproteobacteria bacterium]|nr:NapC/NirT family cytochrome c [Gammaproteobacteria bacterium]
MRQIRKLWGILSRPSARYSLGALLTVGVGAGIMLWGGFNWAMELSNTEAFCISCHEMRDNVYQEYRGTIHDANRSGVRAICADCHVPKEWGHKVFRKVMATNELFHKIIGSVNTKEKFEAARLELAQHVWESMKATDSRECRNCHLMVGMDLEKQKPRARAQHVDAKQTGETCIDCHKGIAHKAVHKELEKPAEATEEEEFVL